MIQFTIGFLSQKTPCDMEVALAITSLCDYNPFFHTMDEQEYDLNPMQLVWNLILQICL
jgi:hypothetical protein